MIARMARKLTLTLIALLLCTFLSAPSDAQLPENPFAVVASPPEILAEAGQPITLQAVIQIPEGFYVYEESTQMEIDPASLEGLTVTSVTRTPGTPKDDIFMGKVVPVYVHDAVYTATLVAPKDVASGPRRITAEIAYQGCSTKICFRRVTRQLAWTVDIRSGGVASAQTTGVLLREAEGVATDPSHEGGILQSLRSLRMTLTNRAFLTTLAHPNVSALLTDGKPLTYMLTFLGGVLTSFTPCVLPMIPVILLIIGIEPGARRKNFWLSLWLALGVAATASAVGTIAALAGVPMAFLFQQRWVVVVIIGVFTLMALSMFGLFTLQLPPRLQQAVQRMGGRGPKGAFLAGVSTGVLATPCAGPVVAALVAYVGTSGDVVFGTSLLLTYGLGFGVIFLLIGTFYGELAQRLPRGGVVRFAKVILGVMLLLPAGYYTWVLTGTETTWIVSEHVALRQAAELHRPILMEFTAKSCPPCLVMEHTTFQDPQVLAALASQVVPLRIDMTFPSEAQLALADRYQVVGWPALLFTDPAGAVFPDLSLIGEIVAPEKLLSHIAKAAARVP